MRKLYCLLSALILSTGLMAQTEPIFYEGFDRCIDEEGENYGYTGGNDGQWGGDIAKAQTIYQDAPTWTFDYCNGAYQCLKVGTSQKQGSATTRFIECKGEAVLSFRIAPWDEEDKEKAAFFVTIKGATPLDPTSIERTSIEKHKWTEVTIRLADIQKGIQITFSSTYKHRFFLDDVCVRPTDPATGVIRTSEGSMVDFGLLGRSYNALQRTIYIEGANLSSDGITASLEEGEADLFLLSPTQLPAAGGNLDITFKSGAATGQHGCYLYLRGKDVTTNQQVEKRVTLMVEISSLDLDGSGVVSNPYTCGDVISLAATEGTVWTDTYYWVTGYVIGGVKRKDNKENGNYDGISYDDKLSLVLADDPQEKDEDKYVTVQISGDARAALNVVDNPELIGKQIKVQGLLLNDNFNPLYLGKPGVRDVSTEEQYVRPSKETGIEAVERAEQHVMSRKVLCNGLIYILTPDGHRYTLQGIKVE